MEGVHDPSRVRAPALDQRLYPPRPVRRDHLDAPPLLAGELAEEKVEDGPAAPLVRPYEAAAVVVDDDGEVLLALLVGGLVDADAPRPVEPSAPAGGLELGVDAGADAADRVPLDAGELRDGAGGATDREAGHPVLEIAREPRPAARPRHRLDQHAVLGAGDASRPVLEKASRPRQVHRAPQPRSGRPVVAFARPPADGAPQPEPRPRPDADDYPAAVDAGVLDHGVDQRERVA